MLNKLNAYLKLMRWHRPIGVFLLLWPTLWALWIAGQGQPELRIVLIFIAGVFIMRPAGCVINEITDRKFDGKVARTTDRPLVVGTVTVKEAWAIFLALCFLGLLLVLQLNMKTILVAGIALVLSMIYPLMKRYTYLPQVVLGVTWNLGILMAFTAITNTIPKIAWFIYITAILWTIAYDTIYGMADRADDINVGIKSTALLFGQFDRLAVFILQLVTLGLLYVLGHTLGVSVYYNLALGFVFILMLYQQKLIFKRDSAKCIQAFLNNNWIGAIVFIGLLA